MQQKIFIPKGLTVTSPFFYVIEHIPSGKLYAGIKYGKRNCNSEKFMAIGGYQTSSNVVRELIINEGLTAFKIKRIRHFDIKEHVVKYEHRFLVKVNAMINEKFLNKSNGGKTFYNTPECNEIRRLKQIGRKHTEETKLKMKGHGRKHTEETKLKMKGRIISDETKQKLKKSKHTEETKLKMKKAWTKRSPLSDEAKLKRSERNIGRIWWNNGITNRFQQSSPGDDWVKGMLFKKRKPKQNIKVKWWSNGIFTKQSVIRPDGDNWVEGRSTQV